METLGEIPEGLTKEEFLDYRNNEKKEFLKNGNYFQLTKADLRKNNIKPLIDQEFMYFNCSYFEKSKKEEVLLKIKALSELKRAKWVYPPKYEAYYGKDLSVMVSKKKRDSISQIKGAIIDGLYGLNHFYDLHGYDYYLYKKACKCFGRIDPMVD